MPAAGRGAKTSDAGWRCERGLLRTDLVGQATFIRNITFEFSGRRRRSAGTNGYVSSHGQESRLGPRLLPFLVLPPVCTRTVSWRSLSFDDVRLPFGKLLRCALVDGEPGPALALRSSGS